MTRPTVSQCNRCIEAGGGDCATCKPISQLPEKKEETKPHDNQKELIKSMEMLERMTIKGDTNTWLHVSRVADLARAGYFHMKVEK